MTDRIEIVEGDITQLDVDAVVTAANEALMGGGGVDGAVHAAAGPGLFEECQSIGICPEGEARITGAYLLPAQHVIHAVGPVYEDGSRGEADLLRATYRSSLELAAERELFSIAFPCIATGTYAYPNEEACQVAVDTVVEWLDANKFPRRVVFCCYSEPDTSLYRARLADLNYSTGPDVES